MSKLTEYVKALYVENVLKLVHLVVRVECILYRGCVMEFISDSERDKKSLAITIKIKII